MLGRFAMKKSLLACTVLAGFLMLQLVSVAAEQTLYGYVSCSKCEANKGASESHRDCVDKCLAKGASIVLVTDNDHNLVGIENPETVSGHHGHHVALDGYMNGNVFHVISVRIL
jgi:hypothetical protein